MSPQKIGRYEIKSELGRGGMATVYKAYDPRFEREVALKVLPREMLHDAQFRVRFEREAKTIALLEHPAIVPVYDVGEEDGQPYFVMRYMVGGSLADRIKQGSLSLSAASALMNRLASALDEAHLKGIIHRDLKPGNILFDRQGEPYISDFGIAKSSNPGAATVTGGAIIGTPAYMSPEQAQGEQIDGRSDIYALGVILFEMLTGSQPYHADTPMAVVVKHITEPVPHILDVNPGLPVALEMVIEKAMAKNRDDRFSSAQEFAIALDAIAKGQSSEDALKTASIAATRIQASAKTRIGGKPAGKTQAAMQPPGQPGDPITATMTAAGGFPVLVLVGGVLVIMALLAGGIFYMVSQLANDKTPTAPIATTVAAPTATLEQPTATSEPPTATVEVIPPTATAEAVVEASPTATAQAAAGIGGVDKIAFVANNEVWVMNVDGSDLKSITNDKAPKFDLQWIPGTNQLVYISGKNIGWADADTGAVDILTTFPNAEYLEEFRISPDGKQAAISLNRELYIMPFDIETMRNIRKRSDILALQLCIKYTGNTIAADKVKDFRWGLNDGKVSWLFSGVDVQTGKSADLIRILDITRCDPNRINKLDEFPAARFTPDDYGDDLTIPDFDWNGEFFVFNTLKRNGVWGYLYRYDPEAKKAFKLDIFGNNRCCYTGARLSEDGTHLFFAFQDESLAPAVVTRFYYISYGQIGLTNEFTPIPIAEDFFKNAKEAPNPALHFTEP
jgi:serine/threonine-protein kinase